MLDIIFKKRFSNSRINKYLQSYHKNLCVVNKIVSPEYETYLYNLTKHHKLLK